VYAKTWKETIFFKKAFWGSRGENILQRKKSDKNKSKEKKGCVFKKEGKMWEVNA